VSLPPRTSSSNVFFYFFFFGLPLPFLSFFDATDAVSDADSFAEAAVPSPLPDGAAPPPPSKSDARGATGVGGAGPAADRLSSAPPPSLAAAPSLPPVPMDSLAAEGQGLGVYTLAAHFLFTCFFSALETFLKLQT
jgi:hypothetical protein